MPSGSASITIDRPIGDVFAAITDITRVGEWSPECVAGRWIDGAIGPAVGARFEGDNVAKLGPVTIKRWTTTSEVTDVVPNETFAFVAAGYTNWRFELAADGDRTMVTESFDHEPYTGWKAVVYGRLFARADAMEKGMSATLSRMKAVLES